MSAANGRHLDALVGHSLASGVGEQVVYTPDAAETVAAERVSAGGRVAPARMAWGTDYFPYAQRGIDIRMSQIIAIADAPHGS